MPQGIWVAARQRQRRGASGQASEEAIKIIRDPREMSPERDHLLREAALRPTLYRAIINHFEGSLPPSDEVLKTYLIFDVGLRDDAVNDCMRVFADTMAFAKIGSSDTVPQIAEGNSGNGRRRADGEQKQGDYPPPNHAEGGGLCPMDFQRSRSVRGAAAGREYLLTAARSSVWEQYGASDG